MKSLTLVSFLPFAVAGLICPSAARAQDAASQYRVAQIFHPGGEGAWDYLTVDAKNHLLFVPRVTHTQVLDATTGAQVADIPGQKHNHGVALAPQAGRGFISDGDDGTVVVFDLKTYQVLGKIKAEQDADGIIYDPASDKVLLVCGDAGVLIPISPAVDPQGGAADPEVELGGKPEFLATDGAGRAFVNLTDKNLVAVLDTKTMKIIAKWPTAPGGAPVGLSIDPGKGELFIGCRKPQKLIVMSTQDGKVLGDLPIGAGVDATGFAGDAFASCRDGTLTVARETAPGQFAVVQTVHTPIGARTLGLDPATRTLYLPTAQFGAAEANKRPAPLPGTFMVVVVDASPGH
jgi:DNA-binding beta-propeller fold protein YncE